MQKIATLIDQLFSILSVRWSQPSTKKGIITLLGMAFVGLNPEHAEAIIGGLLAVYGVYQTFRDESKPVK